MQYLLLIYTEEPTSGVQPEQIAAEWRPTTTSRRMSASAAPSWPARRSSRSRPPPPCGSGDGQTMTTDGPFAETKEVLGGFYLVEAADLDEAHRVRRR